MAEDANPGEILRALDEEKLLPLFSPALTGPKLNLAGLAKLHRSRQLIPYGTPFPVDNMPLFLSLLAEKLNAREKSGLIRATGLRRSQVSAWQKLEVRAKKLERELKSPKLHKPFAVYEALSEIPGEVVLYLAVHSEIRLVHDRIRNYLEKYLPASLEVTEQDVQAQGGRPGTAKYRKIKRELIEARLNARPKRPTPEEAAPEAPPESPPPVRRLDARQPKVSRA
jgi:hypothetical protein